MAYFGSEIQKDEHKKATFSPLMAIEEFNSTLTGSVFITVDLAGHKFTNYRGLLIPVEEDIKARPSMEVFPIFLNEAYKISDLRQNAIDDHTQAWYDELANSHHSSFLYQLTWSDRNTRATTKYTSTLTLVYRVTPSAGGKGQTFTKGGSPSKRKAFYTVKVQFQEINKWVENRPAFLDLSDADQKEFIDGVIQDAEVKVFSDDPSWVLQGHFFNAAKLDYSLFEYPSSLPLPTGRWARIKTGSTVTPYYSLSKHVMKILERIADDSDDIVKKIKDAYGR